MIWAFKAGIAMASMEVIKISLSFSMILNYLVFVFADGGWQVLSLDAGQKGLQADFAGRKAPGASGSLPAVVSLRRRGYRFVLACRDIPPIRSLRRPQSGAAAAGKIRGRGSVFSGI